MSAQQMLSSSDDVFPMFAPTGDKPLQLSLRFFALPSQSATSSTVANKVR